VDISGYDACASLSYNMIWFDLVLDYKGLQPDMAAQPTPSYGMHASLN
jgi:hypothetical protein